MEQLITREQVGKAHAERLHAHYGERLVNVLLLKNDPFEPSDEPEALHLIAVLKDPADLKAESGTLSSLSSEVDAQFDYAVYTHIGLLSESEYARPRHMDAVAARKEGVVL